jgi:hypothetical protein
MPTAIEDCIITVLGKLIRYFVYTSVSKIFNMSKPPRAKYYSLHECLKRRNGIKYDEAVDVAIVDELTFTKEINSADLKRKIEKTLERTIIDKTYYNHLQRLQYDKIVHKRDTGDRGIKSVYYSLTEEVKKRVQLRLLRVYSDFDSLKKIYANLFLKAITEPEEYTFGSSGVDQTLSHLHKTRRDLAIDNIQKEYSDTRAHMSILDRPERVLPIGTVINYMPIEDIQIIELITYRENTQTHHIREDESLFFLSIPGVSSKTFANTFHTFKPEPETVEKAFNLLLKSRLIKPKMEYRGETRYVLSDRALHNLIVDINLLAKIKREENYIKLTYFGPPSYEEVEKRRVFYTEEKSFRQFYNKKEIQRLEFRTLLREKNGKDGFKRMRKKYQQNLKPYNDKKRLFIDHIKQKHKKALQKYAFLSDIIALHF